MDAIIYSTVIGGDTDSEGSEFLDLADFRDAALAVGTVSWGYCPRLFLGFRSYGMFFFEERALYTPQKSPTYSQTSRTRVLRTQNPYATLEV